MPTHLPAPENDHACGPIDQRTSFDVANHSNFICNDNSLRLGDAPAADAAERNSRWPRCSQCTRCHNPAWRCFCNTCGCSHHSNFICSPQTELAAPAVAAIAPLPPLLPQQLVPPPPPGWARCLQCHRRHNPTWQCRCYSCGQRHLAEVACAMSAIVLPCAICQLHHPAGPCVGHDGPVRVHCAQCGRRHMPSMRCKCRICGFYHPVASPCGNVRSNGSSDVYVGAAFSRDAVTAFDGGLPSESCPHCGALFFVSEAKYINCCHDGTIVLSRPSVPDALMTAITDSHVHACIRQYNSALAMASVGYSGDAMDRNHSAEPHRPHVDGWGSLKISGLVYHRIGGIQAAAEQAACWGQLYMFDAAEATQ